jgi:iron-sulfur cluster assembly protein
MPHEVLLSNRSLRTYIQPAASAVEADGEMEMATSRPRPQVMRLSEAAAQRIRDAIGKADRPVAGVRVGVKNGGCAGMSYTMEYAESVNPLDEVVEDRGVRLLIDPKAVLFLLGTEMDYRTDKLSAGFVFNNPNQTSACGCGESVAITPATADGDAAQPS